VFERRRRVSLKRGCFFVGLFLSFPKAAGTSFLLPTRISVANDTASGYEDIHLKLGEKNDAKICEIEGVIWPLAQVLLKIRVIKISLFCRSFPWNKSANGIISSSFSFLSTRTIQRLEKLGLKEEQRKKESASRTTSLEN